MESQRTLLEKVNMSKTITIKCEHCKKEFQYGLTDIQRKLLFSLITSDKDMMYQIGQMAAKAYLDKKNEK